MTRGRRSTIERGNEHSQEHETRVGLRRWVIAITVVVALVVAIWCVGALRSDRQASPGVPEQVASTPVETAGLPRLLDLGADKCVPCKMMAPILDELRETYAGQLEVVFVDVWEDPAPGRQYGVQVIPTQIFFDEQGVELFRHQGFMSREDILAKWRELGYEFR